MSLSLRSSPAARRCRLLLPLGVGLVLMACGADDAVDPDPSEPSATVAGSDAASLPDTDSPFVRIGDTGTPLPVVSSCAASTSSRSTVVAIAEDGTEVAVTVFTTDPGPTVEVDVVTSDGRRLAADDLARSEWAFIGSSITASTTARDSAGPDIALSVVVDLTEGLPACDTQGGLGPGEGLGTESPADEPTASSTSGDG